MSQVTIYCSSMVPEVSKECVKPSWSWKTVAIIFQVDTSCMNFFWSGWWTRVITFAWSNISCTKKLNFRSHFLQNGILSSIFFFNIQTCTETIQRLRMQWKLTKTKQTCHRDILNRKRHAQAYSPLCLQTGITFRINLNNCLTNNYFSRGIEQMKNIDTMGRVCNRSRA